MPLIEVCFILLMMLSQKSLPKGLRGRNLAWDVGKYIYIYNNLCWFYFFV